MGTSTCIEINQKWKEPLLLWFVIVSKKGTNKSGGVNLLSQPLKEIEEMQEKEQDEDDEVQTKLQLLIDHFSFEKLFNVMSRNGCKILASVYDKMTKLYGLLDFFKPNGSSHDRKNLLNLYNGGNWARHFRSLRGKMSNLSSPITSYSSFTKTNTTALTTDNFLTCRQKLTWTN